MLSWTDSASYFSRNGATTSHTCVYREGKFDDLYQVIILIGKGRQFCVHRVVALTFPCVRSEVTALTSGAKYLSLSHGLQCTSRYYISLILSLTLSLSLSLSLPPPSLSLQGHTVPYDNLLGNSSDKFVDFFQRSCGLLWSVKLQRLTSGQQLDGQNLFNVFNDF